MKGYFITATDTDAGKTFVTAGLLYAVSQLPFKTIGFKPVASGCIATAQGLRNEDALQLIAAANTQMNYSIINPYAFEPAIAPHLAAQQSGISIDIQLINRIIRESIDKVDYAFGITSVNDRESSPESEMVAVAAQQHVGGGVKSAADYASARLVGNLPGAPEHFLCCTAGECQKKNRLGIYVLFDKVRHPVHQGPGLAAAGTGNDKQWPITMGYRIKLGFVQNLTVYRGTRIFRSCIVVGKNIGLHGAVCTIEAVTTQWMLTPYRRMSTIARNLIITKFKQ